jgi:hypothetical protein
MKIWITSFIWDDSKYEGPNVVAETFEKAQFLANLQGLAVEGELVDIISNPNEDFEVLERTKETVIH